jgi:hypothetical protein
LNHREWTDFIADCQRFCAEELSVIIPDCEKQIIKECKYQFNTCGNFNETMCKDCIDGSNYEFLQGSKSHGE